MYVLKDALNHFLVYPNTKKKTSKFQKRDSIFILNFSPQANDYANAITQRQILNICSGSTNLLVHIPCRFYNINYHNMV